MDRLYSPEDYIRKGLDFLSYLAEKLDIKTYFSLLNGSLEKYTTYYCILYSKDVLVSEGIGKGVDNLWCKASAIYECIENLADEPIFFSILEIK